MSKLYANENFPLPVVLQLRDYGHDVLTTLDAGKANQAIEDDAINCRRLDSMTNRSKDFRFDRSPEGETWTRHSADANTGSQTESVS